MDKNEEVVYSKASHDAIVVRLQAVLNFGLELAKTYKVSGDGAFLLLGRLEDETIISVGRTIIGIGVSYFSMQWEKNYLRIQYNPGTELIADSAQWDAEGNYKGVGHIQTAYSGDERPWKETEEDTRTDPEYEFDFIGLMESVKDWKVVNS